MIMERSIVSIGSIILLGGTLLSCGGGGGDGLSITAGGEASAISVSSNNDIPAGPTFAELMASSAEADSTGTVIDSAVSGLRYKSGEHYGITDSEGNFGYIQGETIEFFVGGIRIGDAIEPVARVTPYELASGNTETAMNIARVLQTLDNDADPENGIQINDAVHNLAEGKTLDFGGSGWPGTELGHLVRVDGEWIEERTDVELLVSELTSATEAGARNLLSASSAMSHLSFALLEIILSLAAEAESVLGASTCETDSQCQITQLSNIPRSCSLGYENVAYSEVDADLPTFELLEAQRVYLIDMREKLTRSVWGPDNSRGSCVISWKPTWAICGETNHCEMTSS
ncbi:Uncharacterised protein [Halioglobus japonicus]|nr:Uncharacterised protein [Halioglobus japonicus]